MSGMITYNAGDSIINARAISLGNTVASALALLNSSSRVLEAISELAGEIEIPVNTAIINSSTLLLYIYAIDERTTNPSTALSWCQLDIEDKRLIRSRLRTVMEPVVVSQDNIDNTITIMERAVKDEEYNSLYTTLRTSKVLYDNLIIKKLASTTYELNETRTIAYLSLVNTAVYVLDTYRYLCE